MPANRRPDTSGLRSKSIHQHTSLERFSSLER
jgi:hypothetical protein